MADYSSSSRLAPHPLPGSVQEDVWILNPPLATDFFPKPTPLDVFVGSPIHIPEPVHQEGGSSDQVDELHGKFLVELQSLWEKGQVVVKDRHGKDPTQLRFV